MANTLLINYCAREDAIKNASNDIEQALKLIADVFKNFQDDYLVLLKDHKRISSIIEHLETKNNHTLPGTPQRQSVANADPETPDVVDATLLQNEIPNKRSHREPETPGVVESTQFVDKFDFKQKGKLERRKMLGSLLMSKSSNTSVKKVAKPSCSTSLNSQSKNLKQICLSEVDSQINVSSKGKISRQSKLVFQPIKVQEQLKPDIPQPVIPTTVEAVPENLDIDETLFDQPFTQELTILEEIRRSPAQKMQEDIVERSPAMNSSKKKNRKRFKNSPGKTLHHDTAMISDCVENISPRPNQSNATVGTDKLELDKVKLIVKTPNRPATSDPLKNNKTSCPGVIPKKIEFDNEPVNDTYYAGDETIDPRQISNALSHGKILTRMESVESDDTYFDGIQTPIEEAIIIPDNKAQCPMALNNADIFKRKFPNMAGPSTAQDGQSANAAVDLEYAGNFSDWEPDISNDTPPKKKVLLNSFDVVPEKKKTVSDFGFKGPVVRKKAEREKLCGWDCGNCEPWYEHLNLPPEELEKRRNGCSRHRSKHNERYYTPPGFWDHKFPDTENSSQE